MSDAHEVSEVFRHDGFGRKLGPLPIWGWAIVLAAVVFIYIRFFSGGGSSSGSSSASTAVPNVMTTGGYLPASTDSGSTGSGSSTGSQFTDNGAWENYAIQSASQYGTDPLTMQGLLDQYQKGGATFNPTQQSIIDKVLTSIGAPPTGTLGSSTLSGDGATATAAPIAAGLFAPTYNGNYVRDAKTGLIAEVESDGSLLGFTPDEWSTAAKANGGKIDTIDHIGNAYSVGSNLSRANK